MLVKKQLPELNRYRNAILALEKHSTRTDCQDGLENVIAGLGWDVVLRFVKEYQFIEIPWDHIYIYGKQHRRTAL